MNHNNTSICTTYRGGYYGAHRYDEIVALGINIYCILQYAYENGFIAFLEYIAMSIISYIIFLFFGCITIIFGFGIIYYIIELIKLVEKCRNKCKTYIYYNKYKY